MKLVSTLPLIFLIASSALGQRGGVSAGHTGAVAASGHSFSMVSPGPSHSPAGVAAYHPNLGASAHSLYSSPAYSSPIGPPPFGGTQPNPGKRYPYPTNGNRSYYSRGAYFYPTYLGYGGFYGYAGYADDSSYGDQPQPAPAYQDTNYQDMTAQAAPPPDSSYGENSAQANYGQGPAPRPAYQPQAAAPASDSGPARDHLALQGWAASAAGAELCCDQHYALRARRREAACDSAQRHRFAADAENQPRCGARLRGSGWRRIAVPLSPHCCLSLSP